MDKYQTLEDLEALKEIRELIQQRYLEDPGYQPQFCRGIKYELSALPHLATLKC